MVRQGTRLHLPPADVVWRVRETATKAESKPRRSKHHDAPNPGRLTASERLQQSRDGNELGRVGAQSMETSGKAQRPSRGTGKRNPCRGGLSDLKINRQTRIYTEPRRRDKCLQKTVRRGQREMVCRPQSHVPQVRTFGMPINRPVQR